MIEFTARTSINTNNLFIMKNMYFEIKEHFLLFVKRFVKKRSLKREKC